MLEDFKVGLYYVGENGGAEEAFRGPAFIEPFRHDGLAAGSDKNNESVYVR